MATTLLAFTDVHAGSNAEGQIADRKLTRLAPKLLERVLSEQASRPDIQGVLDLGDLIEHVGSSVDERLRAEIDTRNFHANLEKFSALEIPHMHCLGNHPVMAASEAVLTAQLGLDKPYYARTIGDHHVIMLHSRITYREDTHENKSGSGIYIDEQQLNWLRDELKFADRNVLVCCHHPLTDQDLRGNVWFERYPQCALTENRDRVQQLLHESGKVVAVLSGHTHWNYLSVDTYGTPHLTLQSLSEDFRGDGTPANTHGIVVLKDAAFNVEIFGNDLSLRGAEQNPHQIACDLAETYNSIARVYDEKCSKWGAAELEQYTKAIELLRADRTKRVVDLGCGPGRDISFWTSRGFRYVGVDVSQGLLEIARQRGPAEQFINDDFCTVDLPSNSASIVIHNSSLQHVPRIALDAALRKAFEALAPGGIFYCHYRSGEGESLSISTEYGRPISRFIALYTAEEMEAALRRVGFEVLDSVTFDHKYDGLKGKVVQYKTRTFARKPGL